MLTFLCYMFRNGPGVHCNVQRQDTAYGIVAHSVTLSFQNRNTPNICNDENTQQRKHTTICDTCFLSFIGNYKTFSEFLKRFLGLLALGHLQYVESDGLAERTTLTDCHYITNCHIPTNKTNSTKNI